MAARRRSQVIDAPPRGFRYLADFIEAEEERRLLEAIERLRFEAILMHGVEARRRVVHYGVRYAYGGGELLSAPALPPFLESLYRRAAVEARLPPQAPTEALVTRYPPGAGIGWHRDAPQFGPGVVGVSLGAPCELRLRLVIPEGYQVYKQQLAPRSLYVLSGVARFRWQHAIPAVPALRYSITFRTVRTPTPRGAAVPPANV